MPFIVQNKLTGEYVKRQKYTNGVPTTPDRQKARIYTSRGHIKTSIFVEIPEEFKISHNFPGSWNNHGYSPNGSFRTTCINWSEQQRLIKLYRTNHPLEEFWDIIEITL